MKPRPTNSEEVLETSKLRRTPVRIGVLRVLHASHQPLDVPQIMALLPSHTDAVTVYRTLNTFIRKKLIHRFRGEDRAWRYAAGDPDERAQHQHPHFVCSSCGRVECMESAKIPNNFIRSLGVGESYAISYSEVILHGSCPKCR